MIGSNLTRFYEGKFLIFDTESSGLNLYFDLPWELSYAVATLKGGIQSVHTSYIWWPNLKMGEDAARVTRFQYDHYKTNARPLKDVWAEFSPLLYSSEYRPLGHNIIGFDYAMISIMRRTLGLEVDNSWMLRSYDTDCLGRAMKKNFIPDISSPEAFLGFMFKCQNWIEKGLKSNLGSICKEFKLEYDEYRAHGAEYDTDRNWAIFKEMVFKMDL